MVAKFSSTALQKLLIEGLDLIPQDWALTPLRGNKAPYRTAWQHESPIPRNQIIAEIESGQAKGYGIRTGTVSGGIVAIDFDGSSAMQKALELSGGEPLPDTVSFTSNRTGREQRLYLIPQEYWGAVKTTKIKTGVVGDDGKPEQLELRWDGCQSVLPPSVHPTTGHYRWCKSHQELVIAPAPMWVIEKMLIEQESTHLEPELSTRPQTSYTAKRLPGEKWTDEEWTLSYLEALNPYRADDYDNWLAVGMALHSVSDSLLTEWDKWSQQSAKYKPGCCEKKWKSFKRKGVAIGTLAHMAKQDGWQSPFEKTAKRIHAKTSPEKKAPVPALIPEGRIEFAKLPTRATHPEARKRGPQTEIEYPYSDTQWVLRVERPSDENLLGYEKALYPYYLSESGEPTKGKGTKAWNPYRMDELEAHGSGKWVLGVEEESCVEAARDLGLVSFTLPGSPWNQDDATRAVLGMKTAGISGVIFFPNHDDVGYKKACVMADAAAKAQLPFILLDPTLIWAECQHKQDIADWVKWGMEQGWDKEEFVRKLEAQFNAAAERERLRQDIENDDWDDSGDDIPGSFNPRAEFTQFTLEALYGDKPWICIDKNLYFWAGTHYKHSKDAMEIRRLADFCNTYAIPTKEGLTYPFAKPSKVKEALEWVKMRLSVDPDLVNPPGLNCINGVLQIHWEGSTPSWKLVDHSPELYYTYEPLVKYDPEANGEACASLLEALDAPQRDIFLKTIAASLDLATVRQYKGRLVRGLLLKGHGSNGKDTLREAVSAMYGHQGMTGKTLTDFAAYDEGRKFPLASLKYSRVNWASENANTTRLDKIQSLKAFITGDKLDSERKGQDEDSFKPQGIALFNCNDTPNLQGTLEAIAGRYGVLSFLKTFKIGADPSKGEIEADPRFKDDPEFLKNKVLPAFLNRVLDALVRLMSEGIDYSCTLQALEAIQAENSHLFQFCKDTNLNYDASGVLTASDIWERLEPWYLDNGTLTYEEGSNGKQKAIWAEQSKPSDRNVKAVNQVIARFRTIFPKAKLVTVPHESGKKNLQALQGIDFICGGKDPDGNCDNNPDFSTPIPPTSTPIPPQSPPHKTTANQGFHPNHPNIQDPVKKNEFQNPDRGIVTQGIQESSDTPQNVEWVGCDDASSSLSGVEDCGATGVQVEETGVGEMKEAIAGRCCEALCALTVVVENAPQTPDEFSFEEEVAALAGVLAEEVVCPDRSELATIRQLYSPAVLNAACKRLSIERHAQIKQWVIELNEVQQAQKQKVGDNPLEVVGTSIQLNMRVRVHCQGSQRDKKTGVVKRVDGQTVVVRLDDTKLRYDLQMWECNVSWLEIL
jgi:putative DNA primase/helicase